MLCLKVIQIMIRQMEFLFIPDLIMNLLNLDAKYYYILGVSII